MFVDNSDKNLKTVINEYAVFKFFRSMDQAGNNNSSDEFFSKLDPNNAQPKISMGNTDGIAVIKT